MTDERRKAVVSWSSGKDSAFALHEVRKAGALDVVGLLTTVTSPFDRVSMHGVRRAILARQARALHLPLTEVEIPFPCPNEVYEERMARALRRLRSEGVERVIFGDLFLEDIRSYREAKLAGSGIGPLFPLWGRRTKRLAIEMIEAGIKAQLVCVDPRKLPRSFAGRRFDRRLLEELPDGVDPCGENGEFHTCVTNAPGFATPVGVRAGEVVEREGFVFADLIPADDGGTADAGPSTRSRRLTRAAR